jgi:hypothetical protein
MIFPRSLASALFAIGIITSAQAIGLPVPQRFMDVPAGAWYASYIEEAAGLDIVSGYRDRYGQETGLFGPEKQVTVAEALKIVLESAEYDKNRGTGYGHWAVQYLSIARGIGFAVTLDPQLNLDRSASRAEVASIVVDAFRMPVLMIYGSSFKDVSPDHPYSPAIDTLRRAGIVTGDTDGSGAATSYFRPEIAINRAEVVKIALGARNTYGTPGGVQNSSSSDSGVGGCPAGPICRIPPPGCTYVNALFDARGCQLTCGTFSCASSSGSISACAPIVCSILPSWCTYVNAQSDSGGCKVTCGTVQCSSSSSAPSSCVPMTCPLPVGGLCRYMNPLRDSSGCPTTCGTLECGGAIPCQPEECGRPAPGIANRWCPDGSTSGPVCERTGSPFCGWVIRQCPVVSSSSQSSVAPSGCLSDSECVSRGQGPFCRHYDDQGRVICNSYCSTTNGQMMCAAVCAGMCSSTPDVMR